MEISVQASKKLRIELSYDPAIPLLGIYQKEYKSSFNRDIYTTIFAAVLVTIAFLWNQI
jgi:hypothetical protein